MNIKLFLKSYVCLAFFLTLFLVSCNKESIQPTPYNSVVTRVESSSDALVRRVPGCCACNLIVRSTDASVSIGNSISKTWAVSLSYEGDECGNGQNFFIVGGKSTAQSPAENLYTTPGEFQFFPLEINANELSQFTLRTYVGDLYESFPIEIDARLSCRPITSQDILPRVTLECEESSPGACSGSVGNGPEKMHGTVENCAAIGSPDYGDLQEG